MPKQQYVEYHLLQTVPPANLNRDDQGNPKEAFFGGVRRSRVSSQAWKRATRIEFDRHLPEADQSTRTKQIAKQLAGRLRDRTDVDAEQAQRLAGALLEPLGIKAGRKAGDTAYLLYYGYGQLDRIVDLVADRAIDLAALPEDELTAAVKDIKVADELKSGHPMGVALFGRMVADIPSLNVDAAAQVAHALSTHRVELEADYYTAVDDANEQDETGAGMIGSIGFNSATLYRYAVIGLHQLVGNIGSTEAALEAIQRFGRAFALSMPTGHITSFAHRTRPSLVAVVVRDDQPVNLVSAFERPVPDADPSGAACGVAAESAGRLAHEYLRSVRQWGDQPVHAGVSHAFDATADDDIARAFGDNQPFDQMLQGLDEALARTWQS
ncbi:type I-E CRISPR-associated protein Cas7/Cse4/CasC [Actinomadura livida]|uniref:CRISPR system Cascade subunit CasC n=1 Tax=Actinomadura livida TaxID=79909 RepID=A0A7W7N209_9ACTN|nr:MULTISPECIES: type I-E CRISPR-associated protein Cas7/Cse4/CasC [Actinomadura]MBB4778520.1 CRISPR system Cascade subunit CasC [Actinomadura catellatispora]GGU37940.1 type I-E CRISPR-associated protein Cas7/Cse4/CasC [Actinomadura livida]